jgi:hypothetical protein
MMSFATSQCNIQLDRISAIQRVFPHSTFTCKSAAKTHKMWRGKKVLYNASLTCYYDLPPPLFVHISRGWKSIRECIFLPPPIALKASTLRILKIHPESEHPPEPGKPVTLRTCSVSGQEFGCMTTHPSPPKSVILEDLFDIRKPA